MPFVKQGPKGSGNIVTDGDLHSADLTTSECLVDQLDKLSAVVSYVQGGGSSVTALNFQMQVSHDNSAWFNAPINIDKDTPPNATVTPGKFIVAVSGSLDFVIPSIDIHTYPYVRFVIDHTGATAAGDEVTMDAYAEEPTAG
jgi:hypothetical protein